MQGDGGGKRSRRDEGFGLVDDGEFIDNKEDRVHMRHGDHHIIDESRDGCNLREVVRKG